MQLVQGNVVLPPIGPLFVSNTHPKVHMTVDAENVAATANVDTLPMNSNLLTPTSAHISGYSQASYLSSSPVKKGAPHKKAMSKVSTSNHVPVLHLNSLLVNQTTTCVQDLTPSSSAGSSPTKPCEEEKLRLSRERNRLHAQRTRIRKRELLESLKERITSLQNEYALLKQAYEFHATAVCLLSLGNGELHPTLQQLDNTALEAFNDATKVWALDTEEEQNNIFVHEKDCEYYQGNDDDDGENSPMDGIVSCSCADRKEGQKVLRTSKRSSSPSSPTATTLLMCSKEEREQLRRERNRLHARRARLRKKLVLEKCQQAVQEMRTRNDQLRERLTVLVASIYGTTPK